MIEFALSKLNLLIFVTAIAAIVVFFIGSVNSNMKIKQSYELVYKVGKELKIGIDSSSYCTVKFIDIPRKIYVNSGGSDAFSINYKLNVAMVKSHDEGTGKIVLSVIDRKPKKPQIYAAYDIDYNGEVEFYDSNFSNGSYQFNETKTANFDPQKSNSIDNTILFVKKIESGKPKIYLIPCLLKNGIYQCRDFIKGTSDLSSISCLQETAIPELYRGA